MFLPFCGLLLAFDKMEEEAPSGGDNIVTEYATYDEFLDSQITPMDLYYLEVRIPEIILGMQL